MAQQQQLDHLRGLLPASQVFEQGTSNHANQSAVWSLAAKRHPTLVLQPTTLEAMAAVVKALYNSDLDFAVRNTGTGGACAEDVVLSTHGFQDFSFDESTSIVTLGAGLDWGGVEALMEEHAPGYHVVGARCNWVGVTGSALAGGLSWLSHEFGLVSDPQNLLDMQIVLRDGRVLWASEEPELMWALRGGGGNFGVVTALKLQARPYPSKIFTGVVFFPYSSLRAVSAGFAKMALQPADPKVAMFVRNRGAGMGEETQGAKPGLAIVMYDANGEAHARSEDAFAWVFEIPGGHELGGGEGTLRQALNSAEGSRVWEGNFLFWGSAPLVEKLDDETLVRAWEWYEESINKYKGFEEGSCLLIEFMQKPAMNSSGGRDKTSWPHSGQKHVMQIMLGCKVEGAPSNVREIALEQLSKCGPAIAGPKQKATEYCPSFIHEWNDLDEVYGGNLRKLKKIKKTYDPKNRFNKGVDLANHKVTA